MSRSLALLMSALLLGGCALKPVEPWQREHLAKPGMAWEPGFVESEIRTHTYVSKEASSGGAALAGGGCGCK